MPLATQEHIYQHERIFTTKDMEIAFIEREDPGSYTAWHWHDSIEIIYITQGSTEVLMGQNVYRVQAGECMVINSGTVHSTRNLEGNRCILLQIPLDVLARYIPDAHKVYFDVPLRSEDERTNRRLEQMKKVICRMRDTDRQKADGYTLRFGSLLYELLYELYHYFRSEWTKLTAPQDMRKEGTRLAEVIDYTDAHYTEAITIAEIAAVIHLQPEYFCRYFKQCMGLTYLEYLNELRLSFVYRDLIDTTLPLYQILERHGFKNYKLFRKLFYKRFQCTPGEMRAAHARNQSTPMAGI